MRAVDQAITSEGWTHAAQVWDYIKASRRQLRKDMSAEDAAKLNEFIVSKRTEEVYILSNGALEAYLPVGHGSKELDKLIRLLAQSDFWEQLPQAGKTELEIITQSLLQDIVKGDGCPKVLGVNPLTEITTKDQ